ncbi:hypothetical protein VTN00DRAFT_5858 [Thermoascus crustaceus]|uniref:uncharacterized protein n=1 Tax=Thermoascus crustaceus TaxID=5088 RepID=UPI0037436181
MTGGYSSRPSLQHRPSSGLVQVLQVLSWHRRLSDRHSPHIGLKDFHSMHGITANGWISVQLTPDSPAANHPYDIDTFFS